MSKFSEQFLHRKILSRKCKKKNNQSEIEEKYCNLKNIKENDPAMSQVLQNLYALQQSKTSTQLKKAYLHFVIKFLAKRQHFEMSELLPLEGLNKQQILAEQKRLLRLLLTATNNDGNGTSNLSMECK
uniref:BESS domain-containing protein n=1 Tax=Globodera pallida TaxID=36090 RepID=A0A183CID9_GLOPA